MGVRIFCNVLVFTHQSCTICCLFYSFYFSKQTFDDYKSKYYLKLTVHVCVVWHKWQQLVVKVGWRQQVPAVLSTTVYRAPRFFRVKALTTCFSYHRIAAKMCYSRDSSEYTLIRDLQYQKKISALQIGNRCSVITTLHFVISVKLFVYLPSFNI